MVMFIWTMNEERFNVKMVEGSISKTFFDFVAYLECMYSSF